jgi:hypothetical protein
VAGASNNPCSEAYAGRAPFSEPETRTLSEYFKTIPENIIAYLDFHSFGQMLMFPFGHSADQISNSDELVRYAFLRNCHIIYIIILIFVAIVTLVVVDVLIIIIIIDLISIMTI